MAISQRPGGLGGPGGFTLNFQLETGARINQPGTGYFRSAAVYEALTRVHEKMSREMQLAMAKELDRKVKVTGRTQRGGERLKNAILNEQNREVLPNAFRVGIPAWLSRSPAKLYWRRIEEGDAATFSANILFTNNIDGGARYGPYSPTGVSEGKQRAAPPGYKHMRMPQHRGPFVMGIGPFPAYRYQDAAVPIYLRANMRTRYNNELKKIGITLTDLGAGKK